MDREGAPVCSTYQSRHGHHRRGKDAPLGGLCHIIRVKVQSGHCTKQICETSTSPEPGVLLVIKRDHNI